MVHITYYCALNWRKKSKIFLNRTNQNEEDDYDDDVDKNFPVTDYDEIASDNECIDNYYDNKVNDDIELDGGKMMLTKAVESASEVNTDFHIDTLFLSDEDNPPVDG